ncbi:MAG: hypothetical protein SH850_03190 [Planctomycetaceae bacterium]|nr:hypothetical protein [Planctomycetaceae bacterium]
MSASADDRALPADDTEAPEVEVAANEDVLAAGLAQLDQRGRSGADWFFWIAALSLVNTAITHSGGDRHFIVGMGVTQIVDGIASIIAKENPEAQTVIVGVAIAFSVFCSGVAAVVGYLSRNRWQVIFGLGMFVYLLDGLLFVLVQDWMSAGFHGFALFCMWSGFSAFRQLAAIEQQLVPAEAQG